MPSRLKSGAVRIEIRAFRHFDEVHGQNDENCGRSASFCI